MGISRKRRLAARKEGVEMEPNGLHRVWNLTVPAPVKFVEVLDAVYATVTSAPMQDGPQSPGEFYLMLMVEGLSTVVARAQLQALDTKVPTLVTEATPEQVRRVTH